MPKKKVKNKKEETSLKDYLNMMFGEGSAQILDGEISNKLPPEEFISTGCLSVDHFLGGGFKRGVFSEVYGAEGSGKTTLALQAAANVTASGQQVVFIDCEQALNISYVNAFGIDRSKFILLSPPTGEAVFDALIKILPKAEEFNTGLIIVDSVAAMCPQAAEENDTMGQHARMMSKGLQKVTKYMGGQCAVLLINQLRSKIGVMFGSPKTTTGGNAIRYYVSLRLELTRIGSIKQKDDIIGQRVKLSCVKNKYNNPYQNKEINLIYGIGFDAVGDIIDSAIGIGLINKSGGWFSIPGLEKSVQGRDKVLTYYTENEEAFKELSDSVVQSWE